MNRMGTIRFQFPDTASTFSAFEMLEELGYDPQFRGTIDTEIEIALERSDLTSALEIAQAYGGRLNEEQTSDTDSGLSVYEEAYQLHDDADELYIPAHTVAEDFSPAYMEGKEEPYFAE